MTLKVIQLTRLWTSQIEEIHSHLDKEERQALFEALDLVANKVGSIYERHAKRETRD